MKVKAYKSYTARKANELNLAVNDIIKVEEKTSIDSWKGKLENGTSGFFPTNCVVPIDGDNSPLPSSASNSEKMPFKPLKATGIGAKKDVTSTTASSGVTTSGGSGNSIRQQQQQQPPPTSSAPSDTEVAPKLPPKPVREQVRVIYGYKAQNEDELTIKEGDIITVVAKDSEDAGWWKGELNGRIALFPDNFVEVITPQTNPAPPPPAATLRPSASVSSADNSTTAADKLRQLKKPDRSASPSTPTTTNNTLTSVTVSRNNSNTSATDSSSSPTTTTTTSTTNSKDGSSSNAFSSVPIIGKMLKFTHGTPSSHKESAAHSSSNTNSVVSNTNGLSKTPDLSDSSPQSVDNGGSREDLFNAEPTSPSKLVHLTAQRPKIPSNSRRPPSLIVGKGADFPDFMNQQSVEEESQDSPPITATKPVGMLKPVPKPEPAETNSSTSPEKKAPWLTELRSRQSLEKSRRNENSKSIISTNGPSSTSPAAPTPSQKPHAPTPPGAKPHVPSATKPTLTSQTNALTSNNNHINNSRDIIESPTTPTTTDSNFDKTSSGANNTSTAATAHSTKLNSSLSESSTTSSPLPTTTTNSQQVDTAGQAEELAKMRTEISELSSTVAELRVTVTDLRKELAVQSANNKSASEWKHHKADLEKQLHEQQVFFESHKKNLSDMVKELINELAEEKKKIAALQIEYDRMRKLTTTTV